MDGRFTDEELAIAKSVDLCAVAESLGYTVKRIGKYHTLKEMDSIRIYNRSHWYRWSRQFDKGNNGGSQIDFLRVFCGMSVKEAVFWLLDFAGYKRIEKPVKQPLVHQVSQKQAEERKPFVLPELAGDNSYLISYLNQERGISRTVIDLFLKDGLIYESRHYHNVVFKGNDKNGVTRFASMRGVFDKQGNEEKQAVIVKCYVKRYRRAKMSGLQKRYYAKLYRIGKLKKKPYSQVWKYRDDIRKMHKLQEQYLFLVRHKIESAEELVSVLDNLTDKKKEASKEKSKTYKAKERFKDIFDKAEQILGLDDAESCYQSGDTFFEDEHNAWERLNTELLAQGYSVEEVESLRKKYESKYAQDCKAERAVSKELSLGKSIWKELTVSASAEEKQYDKETIRDRKEQPVR